MMPTTHHVQNSNAGLGAGTPVQCDADVFSALYEQYAKDAYGLALRLTEDHALAADAFQEAMLRIWRALPSLRPGNTRSWILRVVARECLRLIKAGTRERILVSQAVAIRPCHDGSEPNERSERETLHSELHNAVAALQTDDRNLLKSCLERGLSQRQVSAALGIPQQTVSYRLKYIVDGLRNRYSAGQY